VKPRHTGFRADSQKGAVISDKPDLTKSGASSKANNEFALEAEGKAGGLVAEFWYFLRHNKKWWLTPVFVLLLLLSLVVILGGSGAAPFIYTLF